MITLTLSAHTGAFFLFPKRMAGALRHVTYFLECPLCKKANFLERPGRITDVPRRLLVVVVESLADGAALADAFSGADALHTALGVTATTLDCAALVFASMATVRESMVAAKVDRILMINTLLASSPGMPASRLLRLFSWMSGNMGRGASEQQAVVDALGTGIFASLRWTLVRAAVNSRGGAERPVASADWTGAQNSWSPVSLQTWGVGYWRNP